MWMKLSIDRRENLGGVSTASEAWRVLRPVGSGKRLHGAQCGTASLMDGGVDSREDSVLAAEALIPSLFVEGHVLGIDIFEEARIPDMDLVRRNTHDGAFATRISDGHTGRRSQLAPCGRCSLPYLSCRREIWREYWPFLTISK